MAKTLKSIIRSVLLGFALYGICVASPTHARSTEDRSWLRITGEAFTLYSDLSPARTKKLFRDLQLYYFLVHLIINRKPDRAHFPVFFYAFNNRGDAKRFGLDFLERSHSKVTTRSYNAIYFPTSKHLSFTFKRDYAHHLIRSTDSRAYPLWYEVGLIEYLGTVIQRNGIFKVGDSYRTRYLPWDQWIKLDKVIAPDSDGFQTGIADVFRTEAWALYHYLLHVNQDEGGQFRQALQRYLELLHAGVDGIEAFEKGFGLSIGDLAGRIQHFYYKGGKHRFVKIDLSASMQETDMPEVESIPRASAAFFLARLALAMKKGGEAERLLNIVLASSFATYRLEARCALARLASQGAESADAEAEFERAIAAAPNNTACLVDYAEYLLETATNVPSPVQRNFRIARVHALVQTLVNLDPTLAAPYVIYGRSFLLPDRDSSKAVEPLELARQLVSQDYSVRAYLANAYLATGRCLVALEQAHFVLRWAADDDPAYATAESVRHAVHRSTTACSETNALE